MRGAIILLMGLRRTFYPSFVWRLMEVTSRQQQAQRTLLDGCGWNEARS